MCLCVCMSRMYKDLKWDIEACGPILITVVENGYINCITWSWHEISCWCNWKRRTMNRWKHSIQLLILPWKKQMIDNVQISYAFNVSTVCRITCQLPFVYQIKDFLMLYPFPVMDSCPFWILEFLYRAAVAVFSKHVLGSHNHYFLCYIQE